MSQEKYKYIIADHIKTASFMIASGVKPSGKGRGYVLRRLIRRLLSASLKLDIDIQQEAYFEELAKTVKGIYQPTYPIIGENLQSIVEIVYLESQKYHKAIARGQKSWAKYLKSKTDFNPETVSNEIWDLYQTHGVPLELSEDILDKENIEFDKAELEKLITKHQKLSQTTSQGMFKSGLGEDSEKTRRLHTATHILHNILRAKYGQNVKQMGSAITSQKARFDFTMDNKLSPSELEYLETTIQEIIDKNLDMVVAQMTLEEARKAGAIGLFGEKYGDTVSVYTLQDKAGQVYSREFCTGPHIQKSSEIGKFKILKHKSIGQGLKRLEYDVE